MLELLFLLLCGHQIVKVKEKGGYMAELLHKRLLRALDLTRSLAAIVDKKQLYAIIENAPSNSIGSPFFDRSA